MTTHSHDSANGAVLSLLSTISGQSERTSIGIIPRLEFRRYDSEEDFDSDDQYVHLTSQHKAQLNQFEVAADVERNTTSVSELEDTGIVQIDKRRIRWNVGPSWSHTISERNVVSVGASYTDVRYDDAEEFGLVDYHSILVYAGNTTMLSEGEQLSATIYASRLEADSSDSDDVGIRLNYTHDVTSTIKYTLSFGGHQSTVEQKAIDYTSKDKSTGSIYEANVEKQLEYSTLKINLSQSVEPSGAGELAQHSKLSLNASHRLTELLNSGMEFSLSRNKGVSDNTTFSEWDGRNLGVYLSGQLSKQWSVSSRYQYRWLKYKSSNDSAESNMILLTLTYIGTQ